MKKLQKGTCSFQNNLSRSYYWILMITVQVANISPTLYDIKPSSKIIEIAEVTNRTWEVIHLNKTMNKLNNLTIMEYRIYLF